MLARKIVTAALLLFVTLSVIVTVINEIGGPSDEEVKTDQGPVPDQQIIVYYFHGQARCNTCRTIEKQTREAIFEGFPDLLKSRRLKWQVINVENSENSHFVKDFQLTTRAVVLERRKLGQGREWKDLKRVWELVHGEKSEFLKYIRRETRAFLLIGHK
jgi:hypothetical protein